MAVFDPLRQNVSFYAADGTTQLQVPIPAIDAANFQAFRECISFGSQIGACFVMLVVMLITTPAAKFRRPSSILQAAGLALCLVRAVLLSSYFPTPFNEFFVYFSDDLSYVPQSLFNFSISASTMPIVLTATMELALLNQAWTMVALWPAIPKYIVYCLSLVVTVNTLAWRVAFVVLQNKFILSGVIPEALDWVDGWMSITNSVSIFYFCAVFNAKLVHHLYTNRGYLPSHKTLTPMEILIITNGLLMVIPVVFAGLEWWKPMSFQAGSLTLTTVAVILPLGGIAAQRVAQSRNNTCSCCYTLRGFVIPGSSFGSAAACKPARKSSSARNGITTQVSVLSHSDSAAAQRQGPGLVDMELGEVDCQVTVNRSLLQQVHRI